MDTPDKIMAWQDSSLGRMLLAQLEKNEPESLDQYRKLMREAKGYILWLTAERLLAIGDPEIDVPILIEALGSERSHGGITAYSIERETIEKALCELTGLNLPEMTSPEEWERQWERRREEER
jgi:hypothetical protein